MGYKLNEKLESMQAYKPIEGDYRVRLDANESFILPDSKLKAAIRKRLESLAFNRYPDPLAGELCDLAARYYGSEPENITAGNGSDELISIIVSAFLSKGDTLLTFSHDFSMYAFYAHVFEARLLQMSKREDLTIDFEKAAELCKNENVKMVIFSNPCNPTSLGAGKDEILKFIKEVPSLVVVDEAYMDFMGQSLLEHINEFDNLIILRTMSKAMGMAGLRLGFAVARQEFSQALKKAKSPYNVNAVSQAIACEIFSRPLYIENSINKIIASRDSLLKEFKRLEKDTSGKLKVVGGQANFVFAKAEKAADLFEYLKAGGLIIRLFDPYIRVTAGRNSENSEVITSIEEFYTGR